MQINSPARLFHLNYRLDLMKRGTRSPAVHVHPDEKKVSKQGLDENFKQAACRHDLQALLGFIISARKAWPFFCSRLHCSSQRD
jgi:hypothetical protein